MTEQNNIKWGTKEFQVFPENGKPFIAKVSGRERWALECLIKAGANGCTPIDNPGPRWSAYVYDLRHEHQIPIETETEKHKGDFPGSHARYRLTALVLPLAGSSEVAA